MKKKFLFTIVLAVMLLSATALTSCGKDPEPTPEPTPEPPRAAVQLDMTDVRLDIYDTQLLTATVQNTEEAVVWRSSDDTVVTVAGGLITAIKEGKATVTASAGGATAACAVTVYNSYTAPVLHIDRDYVSVAKDGTFDVHVQTLWKGVALTENIVYTWALSEGSSASVATVVAAGGTATFTGVEYGQTEFCVSASVRGTNLVGKVKVRVSNPDITFEISNMTAQTQAYGTRIALTAADGAITYIKPEVRVYNKGELVPGAATGITWSSESPEIVSIASDGTMQAVAEGFAEIHGEYLNSAIRIIAEAYRPEIEMPGKIYFETYKLQPKIKGVATEAGKDETISIEHALVGTVRGATVNGVEVMRSFGGSTLTVDGTAFADTPAQMGDAEFKLHTDKAIYVSDAAVVTMAIRTSDDFDDFGDVAANRTRDWVTGKSGTEKPYRWDGYFVLAGDIAYNKTFTPFIDRTALQDVAAVEGESEGKLPAETVGKEWDDWQNGKLYGFMGVFDGQGHAVKGVTVASDAGGIFGVMGNRATVRNVSFVDARLTGKGGFLAAAGCGRFENIYIRCTEQAGGNAENYSAMIYSHHVMLGAVNKNVFIETHFAKDSENNYGIGKIHKDGGMYQGVYCVGTNRGIRVESEDNHGAKDEYGVYKTYNALASDNIDFSAWENDFWSVTNKVPYPKKLDFPEVDTNATVERTIVGRGSTTSVSADARAIVTPDAESVKLGVTVVDGILTVPQTVPGGKTVTLTVSSVYEASNKKEYTVRVLDNTVHTMENTSNVYLNKVGDTVDLDISSLSGTPSGALHVTLGNVSVSEATYESGALKLPKTAFANICGDHTVTAQFVGSNEVFTVNVPLHIVTMQITTETELNGWLQAAYDFDTRSNYAGGLFELGDDIVCTGTYTATATSGVMSSTSDPATGGFCGVFDGKGHVIDGLTLGAGTHGFINRLYGTAAFNKTDIYGGGVIKNVAFINAANNGDGGLVAAVANGLIENVFVSVRVTPNGKDWQQHSGSLLSAPEAGFVARNVLIEYQNAIAEDSVSGYPMYVAHMRGNIRGLYAVGIHKMNVVTIGENVADTLGAYADYAALKAGIAENLSAWDTDCWTIKDGVPVHKAVIDYDGFALSVNASTVRASADSQVDLKAKGAYLKYELDQTAVAAGVTVNNFGIVNIPSGVSIGTRIEITVKSYANASVSATHTITVIGNEEHTLSTQNIYLNEVTGETVDIDVSEFVKDTCTDTKVTLNETAVANSVFADGKLKLPKSALAKIYGDKTIKAVLTCNSEIVTLNIPAHIVTMLITTEEQLNSWLDVAYSMDSNSDFATGLFELGNDITCTGNYGAKKNGRSEWGPANGFYGIFDGKGHVIDGLTVHGGTDDGTNGFVHTLFGGSASKYGTIKNVAFTNARNLGTGGLLAGDAGGNIENVYISVTQMSGSGDWANYGGALVGNMRNEERTPVFKNVIVEYNITTGTTAYPMYEKKGDFTNVYAIGIDKMNASGAAVTDGCYADYAAFKTGVTVNEADWDLTYWTVTDGVPVWKNLPAA